MNEDIERANANLRAVCDAHADEWGHHVACAICGVVCCRWWLECERQPLPWACPTCAPDEF